MPEEKDKTEDLEKQKSDKSPEELMSQVSEGDDSLDPSKKKSTVDAMADESNEEIDSPKPTKKDDKKGIKKILSKLNIYLVLFLLLLVVATAFYIIFYFKEQKVKEVKLETTKITQETLDELKNSDATVGDPRQILTIESNAVISGRVVMRNSLDVAGGLSIGGPVSLTSISAAGPGEFRSLKTNDLQVASDVNLGGSLDVAGALSTGDILSVSKDATIGGKLNVGGETTIGGRLNVGGQAVINGNVNVNGTISAKGINFDELSINKINISGANPSVSIGGSAGGGATASIQGSDTAGTITINTGGGTSAGILATVNFTSAYSTNNPHVVISPNGPGCASINYYVGNISSTQFSIGTTNNAPGGASCKFNYIVIN